MAKKAYVRNSENTAWVELASATTDLTNYATKTYADTAASTAVTNLIDAAPGSLDTLNELAAALGDDANYASTVTTALGTKAPVNNPTFTGIANVPILKVTNSAGAEGGEIELAAPATGSTINTGVVIDVQGNNLRFFEKGGTNRGANLGITSLPAGVNSTIALTSGVFARQTSTTSSGEASTVNINTKPWNMPWGLQTHVSSTSNTVTAEKVVGLTTSFTFISGRRYKVSATLSALWGSGRVLGGIAVGSIGGNRFFDNSGNGYFNPSGYCIVTGTGTSQSVTVGFAIISGTSSLAADGVANAHTLTIEDVGPA